MCTYSDPVNKLYFLEKYMDLFIEMGPPMSEKQVKEFQSNVASHCRPRRGMGFYSAFGVGSGNFLGFLISQRGIKMAPEQVKAIEQM